MRCHPTRTIVVVILNLLLIVGTSACTSVDENKQRARLHLQIGTSNLQQRNYPDAFASLLKAEELDPDNAIVQNNLGLAYLGLDRTSDAQRKFERAISLDSKYSEARNNLGRLYIDMGRLDKAIEQLKVVTEDLTYQSPQRSNYNLGLAYMRKGEWAQAHKYYLVSLKADPRFCPARVAMGQLQFKQKSYSKAAEMLDAVAVDCKNDFEEGQYYSGLSYFHLGDRDRSRARFQELLKTSPNSSFAAKAKDLLDLMK